MESAVPYNTGGRGAPQVEQCVCPPGYTGLSCEVKKLNLHLTRGASTRFVTSGGARFRGLAFAAWAANLRTSKKHRNGREPLTTLF